jgi:Protein of unknown function (DUF3014)
VEHWSVRKDDRPYERSGRSEEFWVPILAIALILAAAAIIYYFLQPPMKLPLTLPGPESAEPAAPQAAAPPEPPREPAAPQAAAPPDSLREPAIRHPLETAETPPAVSLPTLDNSDPMMRETVAGVIGRKAFTENVIPGQLVRRIVATVDNLPRKTAPRRMMPLQAVPGAFLVLQDGEAIAIRPANFARYEPYVRVLEAVDSHALVRIYVRAYPLFQRAYEELGYPGRYFNDRLMEAIDDMLAAPEPEGPIQIVQPKVLYQFSDPDLETRSSGQKMLLRMGKASALRVKAKLREIRGELLAAGKTADQANQ